MINERENAGHPLPPEEGDLNTASISKGLSDAEKDNLRKDLEAVESGDGSSESILRGGTADTKDDFHAAWHRGNESAEMDEARMESLVEDFQTFVRSKGFNEEQFSYDELYGYLKYGDLKMPFVRDANPRKEKELEELVTEWEESKKK